MTQRKDLPVIRAAGAVLWRRASEGTEIAVVHRPHYDDWSLPKGKLDAGETSPIAASREIEEETGFPATLGRFLLRVEYATNSGPKTVDYFSAHANAGRFEPNGEVDELRWLPPDDAAALLSYGTDARVLREFLTLPAELTTVLLARHAKAGKKGAWTGDDDLRPLSPAGARQAEALRTMVRPFHPDRVLTAPHLRCVQTVQGIADDVGVVPAHEPLLAARAYAEDPPAGRARLREIAAAGGTVLACSQGEVIPDLVAALAEADGVTLPPTKADGVASKKGSLWVLSFTPAAATAPPRLVAATYAPTPLPTPTAGAT